MDAAKACDAPVILQASRGARSYAGDVMLTKMVEAAELMYPQIPICLHQDDGNDRSTCVSAMQAAATRAKTSEPAVSAIAPATPGSTGAASASKGANLRPTWGYNTGGVSWRYIS